MVRREVILKSIVMIAIAVVLLSAAPAKADLTSANIPDGVGYYQQGGILSNAPDYAWWYGCSPTSAGMMMGYYDRNGYGGLYYPDLVPGGVAETETFVGPPTGASALANQTIASTGHIAAFYNVGTDYYGNSDGPYMDYDDDLTRNPSAFNCLADFMGTSQDLTGNPNGSTGFYFWSNGSQFTDDDAFTYNVWNDDGMYGIGEYVSYAGYDTANLYTQLIPGGLGYSAPLGFTWEQYKAEIDAGRVVMLHVEGHSMFGYGYDNATGEVILHDTWGEGEDRMVWGGSYSGMDMWGVTVMVLTGGDVVPVPAAVLLGILGLGVVGIKLRRYA